MNSGNSNIDIDTICHALAVN